jgi:hypothetical protein
MATQFTGRQHRSAISLFNSVKEIELNSSIYLISWSPKDNKSSTFA